DGFTRLLIKRATRAPDERFRKPIVPAEAKLHGDLGTNLEGIVDEERAIGIRLHPKRVNRVVPVAAVHVPQQVISEPVTGVLAVEVERPFGTARAVSRQKVQMGVLIASHDSVLAPDLTEAGVPINAIGLEDAWIAPPAS